MMPGSIISGNVNIGNKVYLGTNSSIKEELYVGDDITIGLNSGVVTSLLIPGVYVGTPSKIIETKFTDSLILDRGVI